MIIRSLSPNDLEILKKMHKKYSHEFTFEEFLTNMVHGVVGVEDNKIVAAGGLKLILEEVLMQDLNMDIRSRRESMYKIHQALLHFASSSGHLGIHAFIQDPNWLRHLKRVGFRDTKGKAIVCDCI